MAQNDEFSDDSPQQAAIEPDAVPLDSIVAAPVAAGGASESTSLRGLGIAAVVALLALQVILLIAVLRTNNEVSDLRDDLNAATVGSGQLTDLGSGQSTAGPTTTSAPATAGTGNLPRFVAGAADAALGRNLGDVASVEYYSGESSVLAAADGKSRAYMVWAHWCPYCQEELPLMADWHESNAGELENFELVSITTAMDDAASNPLVSYLDNNEFPFPVLFDEDGSLARQFGVNAFPFWVFVAPDGTVVGRAAGAIGADELAVVFAQLNELATQ